LAGVALSISLIGLVGCDLPGFPLDFYLLNPGALAQTRVL
jgi:hypothetical protein